LAPIFLKIVLNRKLELILLISSYQNAKKSTNSIIILKVILTKLNSLWHSQWYFYPPLGGAGVGSVGIKMPWNFILIEITE